MIKEKCAICDQDAVSKRTIAINTGSGSEIRYEYRCALHCNVEKINVVSSKGVLRIQEYGPGCPDDV